MIAGGHGMTHYPLLLSLLIAGLATGIPLTAWANPTPTEKPAAATEATVADPVLETPPLDTITNTVDRAQSPVTTVSPSLHQHQQHHSPQAAYYTPQPPTNAASTMGMAPLTPPAAPTVQTKTITTTEYRPLPGILVLAVPNPTIGKKGFADAAWTLGTDIAKKLAHSHPNTTIYYPAQSIARLEKQHPYLLQTVWRQWAENNHVSPTALNHLTDAVAGSGGTIARVVMVQADVDFNQPEKSWGIKGLYKKHFGDHIPDDMRATMRSTVSVVDTQAPNHEQVWQGSWQHPIKTKHYGNITASVYSDTDSLKAIDDASGMISRVLLFRAPKAAFTQPVQVTTTQVIAKKAGQ